MKPRRRYNVLLASGLALLAVSGGVLHYVATRLRTDALQRRVEAVEHTLASMQERSAVEGRSAEGNERSESAEGYRSRPLARPRILGSGRTKGRVYTDVRYPDGSTFRYYLRTNAPPAEVRAWVRQLADDARDHVALNADSEFEPQ